MRKSEKCTKCKGTEFEKMNFRPDVALEFGTFYLGDSVIPCLYVCLSCGFGEMWISDSKDLDDLRKYNQSKKAKEAKDTSS